MMRLPLVHIAAQVHEDNSHGAIANLFQVGYHSEQYHQLLIGNDFCGQRAPTIYVSIAQR